MQVHMRCLFQQFMTLFGCVLHWQEALWDEDGAQFWVCAWCSVLSGAALT